MANTYSQIYVQCVFSTRGRQKLLDKKWRSEVFAYMSGIIENRKQKCIAINGVEDHVHVFVGLNADMSISALMKIVKQASTVYINEKYRLPVKFSWQSGFGCFSYSKSHVDAVYKYINNQEEHHRQKTFEAEYLDFLKKFGVDYDDRYTFD
jgi:putative transposase